MKYILYIIFSFFSLYVHSQNIQEVRVAFTQTLLPKKQLPSSITTYQCFISTPYLKDDSSFRKIAEDRYKEALKNYPQKIKEAQLYFDTVTLKEYEQRVKDAKEKFKLESEQFDKMSKLEKLALIDKRPELKLPERPTFVSPPEPFLEDINTSDVIILNPETLAKNYIKISGFAESNEGLTIAIDFKGFEWIDPVASIVDVENFNPQTKEKFITKQTQYVTKFRHPVMLDIKIHNEVLYHGLYGETGSYEVMTTSYKPNRLSIERQQVEKTLGQINNYLNNFYGYPKVVRNVTVFYVKNKKGEYDDIEKAKNFAVSGYKNYESNTKEAVVDLENAIAIWEKTYTEVNFEDSKARIDEKVGIGILKNIIFASCITNSFDKAEKYIQEFKKIRLSYEEKQALESFEKMHSDMKLRFAGN